MLVTGGDPVTRQRRTRVLILGDDALRQELANEVRASAPVVVVEAPRWGLVLATARESARRSLFHLGEVLVTQAKVRVAGATGLGLVRGNDLEAALDLALIDAACQADLPLVATWEQRLFDAENALERQLDAEQASLRSTKVEFETLDQPRVS